MKVLFLDYESFYEQKTYSLSNMTPVEYICDPRWETIGSSGLRGQGWRSTVDRRPERRSLPRK